MISMQLVYVRRVRHEMLRWCEGEPSRWWEDVSQWRQEPKVCLVILHRLEYQKPGIFISFSHHMCSWRLLFFVDWLSIGQDTTYCDDDQHDATGRRSWWRIFLSFQFGIFDSPFFTSTFLSSDDDDCDADWNDARSIWGEESLSLSNPLFYELKFSLKVCGAYFYVKLVIQSSFSFPPAVETYSQQHPIIKKTWSFTLWFLSSIYPFLLSSSSFYWFWRRFRSLVC